MKRSNCGVQHICSATDQVNRRMREEGRGGGCLGDQTLKVVLESDHEPGVKTRRPAGDTTLEIIIYCEHMKSQSALK